MNMDDRSKYSDLRSKLEELKKTTSNKSSSPTRKESSRTHSSSNNKSTTSLSQHSRPRQHYADIDHAPSSPPPPTSSHSSSKATSFNSNQRPSHSDSSSRRPSHHHRHHHQPKEDSRKQVQQQQSSVDRSKSGSSRIVLNENIAREVISDEEHSDIELKEEEDERESQNEASAKRSNSEDEENNEASDAGEETRKKSRYSSSSSAASGTEEEDEDGASESRSQATTEGKQHHQRSSDDSSNDDRRRYPHKSKQRSPRLRSRSRSNNSDSAAMMAKQRSNEQPDESAGSSGDDDQLETAYSRVESKTTKVTITEEKVMTELYEEETAQARPHPEVRIETVVYHCALSGCRSVEEFECLNKIEEGAYGVVYRAKDKKANEIVALKRLKMEKEREGFPITSLREVDTLLKAGAHPNVVTVREIVVGSNMDKIYMVMDYVEHDLKSLMQSMKKNFMMSEVKCLMKQLLSGVAHLHDNWIIHRDLKTSNLLLSHKGVLKIADFGLAREYGSPLKEYTSVVVTLWYRSPELLLGIKKYSTGIDIWSVGCIFGELMLMKALFPGRNEKDQLDKIFKDLGTPTEHIWPGWKELPLAKSLKFPEFPYNTLRSRFGTYLSEKGLNLINAFLTYSPQRRFAAEDALKHDFFKETPLPIDPSVFPTWPAKSEGLNKNKSVQDSEPRAPSAGKAYEKLMDEEPVAAGFVLK